MNSQVTCRTEDERDYIETENLIREAFWDLYKPGCDEHFILHNMRSDKSFIRGLSFVCEASINERKKIVGASYCTECRITDGSFEHVEACIGPIGILPEYQRQGIGLKLLALTVSRAADLGYGCAVLFGNPAYYRKSGFIEASQYGIHLSNGTDIPEFMCRQLTPFRLVLKKGILKDNPVFHADEKELAKYDMNFPLKEKHTEKGQLK